MPSKDLIEAAREYIREEPNQEFRMSAQALLDKTLNDDMKAKKELERRFGSGLSFGTAGMRANMGYGDSQFNRLTVAKAAVAIGRYFKKQGGTVVVAYDARNNSETFARDIASILRAMGFFVIEFNKCIATPLCAFAVKKYGATAGLMVTASHNPPNDNGIKVYGSDGAQIASDAVKEIERNLSRTPTYSMIAKAPQTVQSGKTVEVDQLLKEYLALIDKESFFNEKQVRPLKVVYTALHGVGWHFIKAALGSLKGVQLFSVADQIVPDGNFPTLSYPNPEEEGALDLATEEAVRIGADLIVANDPDADRFAVGALSRSGTGYKMLTGNEIGAFLGAYVLEKQKLGKKKLVASTLVSSRQLREMAYKCGASYVESLTGFSRIAQAVNQRERETSEQFVYGYEEALGYCVSSFVRDKDGISATIRFIQRVLELKAEGQSIWDELDRISLEYGLYANTQWSKRFDGDSSQKNMDALLNNFRQLKTGYAFFGMAKIKEKYDLLTDSFENHPKANILLFFLEDSTRLIVRPSGTETKIKFYLEKSTKVVCQDELSDRRERINADLARIRQSVMSGVKEISK